MSAIFQNEKIDIQNISFKTNNNFSAKTMIYIYRLSAKFGFDNVFGRSDVTKLQCIETSNLVQANIIEPVSGYGKGKYKFKHSEK